MGKIGSTPRSKDELIVPNGIRGGMNLVRVSIDAANLFANKGRMGKTFNQRGEINHNMGHIDFVRHKVIDLRLEIMIGVFIDEC